MLEKATLTGTREDGNIQFVHDTNGKRRRTSTKKWTEYMRTLGPKAKTENILITPPVDPQPDLSVQAKSGQEELNGILRLGNFFCCMMLQDY